MGADNIDKKCEQTMPFGKWRLREGVDKTLRQSYQSTPSRKLHALKIVTLVSTVLVPILAPKHTMDILISVDAATTVRPKHTYLGSFCPIHLLFIHFAQTK